MSKERMLKRICCIFLCVCLCLSLCACKSKNAKAVEQAINDIGEVTLEREALISSAEELYSSLTDEEKETIENYQVLTDARHAWNDLAVEQVQTLIADIGVVSLGSNDQIEAARSAYEALAEELQAKVLNLSKLTDAEADYAFLVYLDANALKDCQPINAYKANLYNNDIQTWFGDEESTTILLLCFYLQGITDKQYDSEKADILNTVVCINREDKRVDLYCPYGDGEVMGIQYRPSKGTAQIGIAKTDLTFEEFLQLLVDGAVIDEYKAVPTKNISQFMSMLRG